VKQTLFGNHMVDGCRNGDTDRLDAIDDVCMMKESWVLYFFAMSLARRVSTSTTPTSSTPFDLAYFSAWNWPKYPTPTTPTLIFSPNE